MVRLSAEVLYYRNRGKMQKHWYQSHLFKALWVSALIFSLYFFLLIRFDFFQIRILRFQDYITRWVYNQKSVDHIADPIVLVTIDKEDFDKVRKWPWPRALFAEFLHKLNKHDPKVVFFDIIFHGESPSGDEDDQKLIDAIKEKGNVVLASFFDSDWNYQIPHPKFTKVAYDIGFVNKPRDLDLVVRRSRILVFSADGGVVDLGAEIKVVCKYLNIPKDELYLMPDFENPTAIEMVQPGGKVLRVPIGKNGTLPINYTVSRENIVTIPFWKVLNEQVDDNSLRNKIVLVSITSEAFHDQFNTPTHEDQPGVAIGGNVIQMLLHDKFLSEVPQKLFRILVYLALFFICYLTLKYSFWFSLCVSSLFILGMVILAYFLRVNLIQMDLFSPILLTFTTFSATTIYNYFLLLIRNTKLRQLAITDGLTGMYIYRYLVVRLKNELDRADRYDLDLSFFIADIDHFKKFNDTYGHDVGNIVLKNFAEILKRNSRKTDFVARYGGEEFCILFPHTSQEKAMKLAEKLRAAIEEAEVPGGPDGVLKVTASFGVSSFKKGEIDTVKKLFTAADAALYRAKETGRNRVCGFDPAVDKLPEEAEGGADDVDESFQID